MTTTGVYLTQLLADYGVEFVFGIPGVHTLELYRGLGKSSISHITPRHEQGAGFMADGYARVSGKPGVCFIISGPGMTNVMTPMGQAYGDSIPMLVISTVNAHGRMGSGEGWLHELPNQQALTSGVCAFSHTVHCTSELTNVLARAFAVFDSARPRPVHIELPLDVVNRNIDMPAHYSSMTRLHRPTGCAHAISQAAQKIAAAKRPLILAGGGAIGASAQIAAFVHSITAPVVMTVNARGVLPTDHPLAVPASASLPQVRALIEQADLVLALGTELGSTDYDFNEDGLFKIPGSLIRVDIDPQQIMRSHCPELGIVGDTQSTLTNLLDEIESIWQQQSADSSTDYSPNQDSKINDWAKEAVAATRSAVNQSMSKRDQCYLAVLDTIRDTLPEVVIVGDSTQMIYAGNSAFAAMQPSSYFNSATGFGTLGYALPAAIGAALSQPARPVVAIAGDGGLQFSLAELATAVDANTNITLLVHENGGYAEIKKFMESNSVEPIGVELLIPDIMAIAATCGWQTHRINNLNALADRLLAASSCQTPTLLLVPDAAFDE